jgi:DNA-binding transcriptional LysR family regulator
MLGVDGSTVARRLAKAEEALGATLFHRRRAGYTATAEGEELIALARRVELDIVSVARLVSGSTEGLAGELRVTTSDSMLLFLSPAIASFRALNPAITLDLVVSNTSLNLARGEADVAVRATDTPGENLFGRKAATMAWAPYGPLPGICPLPAGGRARFDRPWVSYSGQLTALKARGFLEERVGQERIAFRTDSLAAAAEAVAAGLGQAYLPCMLGGLHPRLRRIGPAERALDDELWVLTHPDIRRSDRIRRFMMHCISAIRRNRGLIEGLPGDDAATTGAAGEPTLSTVLSGLPAARAP